MGNAQPAIEWSRCYGGTGQEFTPFVLATADSGYALGGDAASLDGDVTGLHVSGLPQGDVWIVKTDSQGDIIWNKCYGNVTENVGRAIKQTVDGGFIVAGFAATDGGDVSGNHNADYWVVKTDVVGNLQWQKCLGGTGTELPSDIVLEDTTYLVTGSSTSVDGDVTGHHGIPSNSDLWTVKGTFSGQIVWEMSYGGSNKDYGNCIIKTQDGGYLMAGETESSDGDITFTHGSTEAWLVKTDVQGNIEWQKCYGGSDGEVFNSVIQLTDGSYIASGTTGSIDGDVAYVRGGADYWVVKTDSWGNILWENTYGGTDFETCKTIVADSDGGFLLAGYTWSDDVQVAGFHGASDYWIIKIDSVGTLQWQKCLGGSSSDFNNTTTQMISKTLDGGAIVTGVAYSTDGDVAGNHGSTDHFVVKFSNTGTAVGLTNEVNRWEVFPNPTKAYIVVDIPTNYKNSELRLSEINGRPLRMYATGSNDMVKILVEDISAGIYILNLIKNNSVVKTAKVVITD